MFGLFRRGSKDTTPEATAPDTADELALYRQNCRRIHQAYLDSQDGTFARQDYLELKVHLLKQAVRDATERDEGATFVGIAETLRLACAINDVELQSIRRHFRD